MTRPAVAFLGPVASYTHQAAKSVFAGTSNELLPVSTIKDVFEAVRNGDAAYGVVPFENSTHGPVTFTLAALADRDGAYGELSVCGETYLAVHHYLLGRRRLQSSGADGAAADPSATGVPLASLDHIARIHSHPQAFGQTTAFFRRYFPDASRRPEMIDASSTSRAAELAAADESGTSAAISSAMAAETSGLDVLARCIEDRADNTTRFYVLRKSPPQAPATTPATMCPKSLVSFTVPHRSPGALADVLECFRRARLNLTSINSLPSLVLPFQYLFFVEFEHGDEPESKESGAEASTDSASTGETADARVHRVLAEVAKVAETHRLLGTWNKPEPLS
ncbi:chorismate mutase [Sporothrix schenckii 1099-18]|uniref:prephenate dehydratase n=1 Tax=Sporothrix schenckii 1099-18 TaxID=1397361 RepID=A0A0F2MLC7_SPOSC|nr:chorismate mutase [Sporothrix schenckii 1099-18]KJR89874.1 chorismate mutase [Sporothrix schenckii 1099-18]